MSPLPQFNKCAVHDELMTNLQDSIKTLSTHVGDSMQRMEHTLDRVAERVEKLSDEVSDLRVHQATHSVQLEELVKMHEEETKTSKERKNMIIGWAIKVGGGGAALIGSAIAGAHGKAYLAKFFRSIAGGE